MGPIIRAFTSLGSQSSMVNVIVILPIPRTNGAFMIFVSPAVKSAVPLSGLIGITIRPPVILNSQGTPVWLSLQISVTSALRPIPNPGSISYSKQHGFSLIVAVVSSSSVAAALSVTVRINS